MCIVVHLLIPHSKPIFLNMPSSLFFNVVAFDFLCGISPHFVSNGYIAGFISMREPSVSRVVSIRKREDPGNENEFLCVAAFTLLGCCHLANFNLFSWCY